MKEQDIQAAKAFRKGMDETLQLMKAHRVAITANGSMPDAEDRGEAIAAHVLSIRHLQAAIHWQGEVLKHIGTPNPYPVSKLTPRDIAKSLYEAYCGSTGGVSAVSGAKLPTWEEMEADTSKGAVVKAWLASAAVHPATHRVEPTAI